MTFQDTISFEQRSEESQRIREKYPNRVPIVCQKHPSAQKDVPTLAKNKYLVPSDLTVAQFMYVIRKRIKMKPSTALFMFINDQLPVAADLVGGVYAKHKSDDGFLYVYYAAENTFGT